jgi:hypothetical protein
MNKDTNAILTDIGAHYRTTKDNTFQTEMQAIPENNRK